jgi:hypothetical protein
VPTLAYAGSLMGATREVDYNSLHRADYVRIKIATKDVSKIPEVVMTFILKGKLNGEPLTMLRLPKWVLEKRRLCNLHQRRLELMGMRLDNLVCRLKYTHLKSVEMNLG